MITIRNRRHSRTRSPRSNPSSVWRLAGIWFLGLAALHTLYFLSAFNGLESGFTIAERVAMSVGPTMVVLSLLLSPSVFAAGAIRFDLTGRHRDGQRLPLAEVSLCAAVAFLLSVLGSSTAGSIVPTVYDQPADSLTAAPQTVLEFASLLVSLSISILVLISGFAGALVSLATQAWQPVRRCATAWFASLALIAFFLVPLLASANAIVHYGASPIWIGAGPLALPLLLTGALAWHQRGSIVFGVGAGPFRARSDALDPEVVDRIISEVAGGLEPGVDAPARTESEAEMAQLAAAIRHVAAPQATMSEARVQQVVADILAKSPAPAPMRPDVWRPRIAAGTIGIFCAAWACLAAGLLIVSPLGGVPPSVVSAVAVGFLGSAGVLWIGRRSPALAATLQT